MLAETPVTQRNPYYLQYSASLTVLLPDSSNYLPFSHTQYLILRINASLLSRARPFTKPSLLQRFTAESSLELMSLEEYRSALRKLNNKQRQVVMFLLLLFKLSSQLPFPSFSFLSNCSLSQSSLFSLFSFSLHPFFVF